MRGARLYAFDLHRVMLMSYHNNNRAGMEGITPASASFVCAPDIAPDTRP